MCYFATNHFEPSLSLFTLYEYSSVEETALMSPSIVRAQLSTSPSSFRLELKLSIKSSQAAVCFAKLVAFRCNCFASESSRFWFRYA